jgi:hypothetical protein
MAYAAESQPANQLVPVTLIPGAAKQAAILVKDVSGERRLWPREKMTGETAVSNLSWSLRNPGGIL